MIKTYIIAELSGNHNGDINRALQLIASAKHSGADAVKLQTYTADTMTIDCDNEEFIILVDELRYKQGEKTIELCLNYLNLKEEPVGINQVGTETFYKRRNLEDSRLDISIPLVDNFNLLRVVDNDKYPAFFEINGHKYIIHIRACYKIT